MKRAMFRLGIIVVAAVLFIEQVQADEIALEAYTGRTWHESDGNGDFNDGVGTLGAASYIAFADRGVRAARSGLEYDLTPIPQRERIVLATLLLTIQIATDYNNGPHENDPIWGPPDVELHGFVGDGVLWSTDLVASNLLAEFTPLPNTVVALDVTPWVTQLRAQDDQFAGFSLRISDDLAPTVHAQIWIASQNIEKNPEAWTPKLEIKTTPVPTPSSLVTFIGLALLVGAMSWWRKRRV